MVPRRRTVLVGVLVGGVVGVLVRLVRLMVVVVGRGRGMPLLGGQSAKKDDREENVEEENFCQFFALITKEVEIGFKL